MAEYFDLPERYPELFAQLNEEQYQNVVEPLISSWLEGYDFSRKEVARFIDHELGRISDDEFRKQILEEALALQEALARQEEK
ncbi:MULTISPECIES: hypothetical protein [Rothia]|jgi:alpha-mannosidase|uniref:hypothetical protein n=1 Tax=Rothia TaxID=32207 RepID=UPI00066D9F7C|nr:MULTISPECIES: hypothetical protein [Rothia]OFM97404.1 hypothetical protein HMPREF2630_00150 [Rothia sp. HMSC072B03]